MVVLNRNGLIRPHMLHVSMNPNTDYKPTTRICGRICNGVKRAEIMLGGYLCCSHLRAEIDNHYHPINIRLWAMESL
jgi:hypothetical protein